MSRPWMPLYVADYLADTGHLTGAEHGAYLLLIMHYWANQGVPNDDDRLARIARMTDKQWAKSKPIIAEFFSDGWKHARIEFELTEAARRSVASSNAGKASAEARRNGKRTTVERPCNEPPTECEPLPPQPPSEGTKEVPSVTRKRASRLASGWQPSPDDFKFASECGLRLFEIDMEAAKFRDFWLAKPGSGGTKLDWSATWRNWCRKASEYRNGAANGTDRRPGESLGDLGRRLAAEARDLERAAGVERADDPIRGH